MASGVASVGRLVPASAPGLSLDAPVPPLLEATVVVLPFAADAVLVALLVPVLLVEAVVTGGLGGGGGLSVTTLIGSRTATTGPSTDSEKPTRSTPMPVQMCMSIGPASEAGSANA